MSLLPASKYEVGDILIERPTILVTKDPFAKNKEYKFEKLHNAQIIIIGKRLVGEYLKGEYHYDYFIITCDNAYYNGCMRHNLSEDSISYCFDMHEFNIGA